MQAPRFRSKQKIELGGAIGAREIPRLTGAIDERRSSSVVFLFRFPPLLSIVQARALGSRSLIRSSIISQSKTLKLSTQAHQNQSV